MIRAIIFDCFGVLAKNGTLEQFYQTLPSDIDYAALHAINHQYDAKQITKQEFLYRMRDLTGHEPEMLEELVDTKSLKNTALLRYIRELKSSYKIGLLSNIATDWVRESFLTPEEQELFDEMVFSYEVGITKPNPEIFEIICSRLAVSPDEAFFVDDIDSNVAGAKQAGLQAVRYQDLAQLKQAIAEAAK